MDFGARFCNKVVIVTGAATGMGRATLSRLVAEGAIALAVDVNEEALKESVELANAGARHGGRATSAVASVSDESAVKTVISELVEKEGRLDVLVNLAGIMKMTHTTETSVDEFMRHIQVNLLGTFLFCRESLPHLLKTGGNIVNCSSTSATYGHPYSAGYAASKGGVSALTSTLAWEYIKQGVRVNAVAPGGVETPMTAAIAANFPKGTDLTLFGHLARPDFKMGKPAEVAGVIAMLASSDGAFMNGAIVRVDGGVHA